MKQQKMPLKPIFYPFSEPRIKKIYYFRIYLNTIKIKL